MQHKLNEINKENHNDPIGNSTTIGSTLSPFHNNPEFIEHPQDSYVTKYPAIVRCLVRNAHIAYIECNNKINDFSNQSLNNNETVRTLIANINRKDLYDAKQAHSKLRHFSCICVAFTENNEKFYSKKAIIRNAYLEKEFQFEPVDETVYAGDSVELRCDAPRGDPLPTVYWLKNDQNVETLEDSIRYRISNDNSLLIFVVNKNDSANYICVATNVMDKRFSKPAKLTVLDMGRKYAWSEWSPWSQCSTQCGEGTINRTRNCEYTKTHENVSVSLCSAGESIEYDTCVMSSCQEANGQWGSWQSWSPCTAECVQARKRDCIKDNEVIDSKRCENGEKLQTRKCDSLKYCQKTEISIERLPIKLATPKQPFIKGLSDHQSFQHNSLTSFGVDKNLLSFFVGIASGVLVLALFIVIVALILRKKNSNKTDLSLYYTCEKPMKANHRKRRNYYNCCFPKDEELYDGQLTKCVASDESASYIIKNSNLINERQILLDSLPQCQKTKRLETALIYSLPPNSHTEEYKHDANVFAQMIQRDSRTVSLSKHHDPNKQSPTNCTTTTTINSTPSAISSSCSSTSSYYATPNPALSQTRCTENDCYKVIQINSLHHSDEQNSNKKRKQLTRHFEHIHDNEIDSLTKRCYAAIPLPNTYSNQDLVIQIESPINHQLKSRTKKKLPISPTSTSAYNEILNNLLNYVFPSDIAAEMVTSAGAKISLESGITLLIPENALLPEQSEIIYLAVCRQEASKPKLPSDKSSLLSAVIMIGPPKVVLLKPVILIIEHCAKLLNYDWNVSLHVAINDDEIIPQWKEELNETNYTSTNLFINAHERHFIIMTDRLARYALTGDIKSGNYVASKYMRLVAFCGSCITNNDFNLRIYCVDNLYVALEEIIRDEEKIGGQVIDTSDPFLVSFLATNNSICICIDELTEGWNCKYNVKYQEIPLNHIWNGRNHLLHCSFTIERIDCTIEQFSCKINLFHATNLNTKTVSMNINYSISDVFFLTQSSETSNCNNGLAPTKFGPCFWIQSLQEINSHKFSKNYSQVDKNFKQKISRILDENYAIERNWKTFAKKLGINRNLEYFASKKSPTETLLLYFEAMNYLKLCTTSNSIQDEKQNKSSLQKSKVDISKKEISMNNEFINIFSEEDIRTLVNLTDSSINIV